MIKGIIFDFDGTILDSVEARISAWKAALADYGADVGEDDIRRDIGIPGSVLAGKYVKNTYEVEMLQERYFMNRIDSMHLFPDVADTFNILRKRGVKIAVVTSTRRIVMDHFTLNADIIVTIDDVKHGKPSTESYEKAISELCLLKEQTMVVGDIENDLVPAKKLGCVSVLVKHGRKVSTPYADHVIDEISDILGLPEVVSEC
ncbi:MAG: HAD family hydrolase [Thermoplasmata archaeon]